MAYFSPAARSGPDPVVSIDSTTGAVVALPEPFHDYLADALTGESTFLWPTSETSPPDKPGILVRSADKTDVFALDGKKTAAVGVQDVFAMWNGLVWIESGAGIDVVVAATGARASGISGGEVPRVPEYARQDCTITEIDGGVFGEDARMLTPHPNGTASLDALNVLSLSPTQ